MQLGMGGIVKSSPEGIIPDSAGQVDWRRVIGAMQFCIAVIIAVISGITPGIDMVEG
jgi:hypothetical protein